jgi:hypothetical protein
MRTSAPLHPAHSPLHAVTGFACGRALQVNHAMMLARTQAAVAARMGDATLQGELYQILQYHLMQCIK